MKTASFDFSGSVSFFLLAEAGREMENTIPKNNMPNMKRCIAEYFLPEPFLQFVVADHRNDRFAVGGIVRSSQREKVADQLFHFQR